MQMDEVSVFHNYREKTKGKGVQNLNKKNRSENMIDWQIGL